MNKFIKIVLSTILCFNAFNVLAANWNQPALTDTYTNFLNYVKARDTDAALLFDPAYTSPTNIPTNTVRWNSASGVFQRWNGSTWVNQQINTASGLTTNAAITGSTITSSTGSLVAESTGGGDLYLNDTNASSDEKLWSLHGENGLLYLRTRTDANGAGEIALQCTRSGTSVGACSIENGAFSVQDAATFNGSVDLSNGSSDVIRIPSTLPSLKFYENDQGTDNKVWSFFGQATAFGLRLESDAYAAGETAWSCSRSGTTVGTCTFDNGNVQIDEALTVSGGATFTNSVFSTATTPSYRLTETDQGADGKVWTIASAGGNFIVRTETDAYGTAEDALVCTRSGTAVGTCTFDNGNVQIDEALTHTKACATNYTRAAPGVCVLTTNPSSVTNLSTDSCSSITFPAGATYVFINAQVSVGSAGSAGSRLAAIAMYSNTGCSTFAGMTLGAQTYEVSGVPASQGMAVNNGTFVIPNNSNYRMRLTDDTANTGSGWYNIPIYWDN